MPGAACRTGRTPAGSRSPRRRCRAGTEITGPVAARLFVSSTTADADLFCVLRVLAPDGSDVTFPGAIDPHTPVAQGWLRVSHRKLDPGLVRRLSALPRP